MLSETFLQYQEQQLSRQQALLHALAGGPTEATGSSMEHALLLAAVLEGKTTPATKARQPPSAAAADAAARSWSTSWCTYLGPIWVKPNGLPCRLERLLIFSEGSETGTAVGVELLQLLGNLLLLLLLLLLFAGLFLRLGGEVAVRGDGLCVMF